MALSDWATVAFDHKGQPGVGWVKNPKGTVLRLYKNWVYLSNKKMWTAGMEYVHPTIAQINEGNMTLGGFKIYAARGPQSSIFVLAQYTYGRGHNFRYFGGIAGSPWRNIQSELLAKAGITNEAHWFDDWFYYEDGTRAIVNSQTKQAIIYHRPEEDGEYDLEEDYLGIRQRTVDEFLLWTGKLDPIDWDYRFKKWHDSITKTKPLCYNQGDAYINGVLEKDIPVVPVGEKPIAPLLIRAMK